MKNTSNQEIKRELAAAADCGVHIRSYNPARDKGAILRCIVELQDAERAIDPFLPAGIDIADEYFSGLEGRWQQGSAVILLAEQNGEIVGFAGVQPRVTPAIDDPPTGYAMVSELLVLTGHRRKGIGNKLLKEAEQLAQRDGATSLRIGVMVENHAALSLYKHSGFTERSVVLEKKIGSVT